MLVADRAFCSYAQLALLARHGVDAVVRLHQRRPTTQWAKDYRETWTRPDQRPSWMDPALWSSLPAELTVRIVRYAVPRTGCRTRTVYVATAATAALVLLINPARPGRWEPRKLKRRLKEYDLLKEPRQNLKAKHRARYA